ncbi:MAG: hypothetical protein HUU46_18365 [Candidatus Hydrogenedentes bacterium]|nr:hypothetical protein [Candidatus Hydrogenedentota bacterium]
MLSRVARPIEIAVGVLFIVSAASKALDVYSFAVQVRAYGIVRDQSAVLTIAYCMVALETALGAALLGGFRFGGRTLVFTSGLLVGFTALIAYAWAFKGLADCGCFGEYIKMGPGTSIAKNVVLLGMTGMAWFGFRNRPVAAQAEEGDPAVEKPRKSNQTAAVGLALAGILIVAGALAMGEPAPAPTSAANTPVNTAIAEAKPFAEFVPRLGGAPVPLAQGEYLVAMLSASCEHCQAVARTLNELMQAPGAPMVVAIMMGTDGEMNDFMSLTDPQFPIQTIEVLTFMNLLHEDASAPPCFYVIRDGAIVRHLVAEEPSHDQLLEFATKAGVPGHEDKQ